MMLIPIAMSVMIAYFIHRFIENPFSRYIKKKYSKTSVIIERSYE